MLEICTGSLADCLAAEKGGAKRVELNSALALGGLTPSLATLQAVKKSNRFKGSVYGAGAPSWFLL